MGALVFGCSQAVPRGQCIRRGQDGMSKPPCGGSHPPLDSASISVPGSAGVNSTAQALFSAVTDSLSSSFLTPLSLNTQPCCFAHMQGPPLLLGKLSGNASQDASRHMHAFLIQVSHQSS